MAESSAVIDKLMESIDDTLNKLQITDNMCVKPPNLLTF